MRACSTLNSIHNIYHTTPPHSQHFATQHTHHTQGFFIGGALLSYADEEDKKAIKDEVCVVCCVCCVCCVCGVCWVCGVLLSHADEEDKKAIKDEVCVVVCVGCVLCVAFVLLVSEYYCVVCCALCVV